MCGIAGIIGTPVNDGVESVSRMLTALAKRGPDGQGIECFSDAVLGHRRLSIFDLSDAGRQPMSSVDRSISIVFNGAIYNFRDLREELKSLGYQFKSQTDTEVLIHGYREWGLDNLVNRLRGMFAFALWDDISKKLFLVRDRLGVKPLVYRTAGNQIAFASNVSALRRAELVNDIDEQAIIEYLELGFVTDERTIYQNAHKVPAATIVEWCGGSFSQRTYWSAPKVSQSKTLPWNDVVDEAERLFLAAVEKRLFADVPVGALLSGGIDSSLVCWAIGKLGSGIKSYTLGTPGDSEDESADAVATAQSLGISHQVLNLSASSEEDDQLFDLVAAYSEPFGCSSALGMLRVSKAAASEATVLLTGDGGDDVFLGYPEHRHFWLVQKVARALPRFAPSVWKRTRGSFPRFGAMRRAASFFDYSVGGLAAVVNNHDGLPFYSRTGILGEQLLDRIIPQRDWEWSLASGRDLLSEFLEHDRRMRFVGEYMTKVDGATMYHSLEARSPFLDQDLWEFASSLPFDVRLRGGRLKAVLRELARRHLGDRVAKGQKRGFSIPVQRWLSGRWRQKLIDLMQDSYLASKGWIRSEAVLNELDRAAQVGWAPKQLWYLLVLEMWLRNETSRRSEATETGSLSVFHRERFVSSEGLSFQSN